MFVLMGMLPENDAPIAIVGLRPGEKLTEYLVDEDEIVMAFCEGMLEVGQPQGFRLVGRCDLGELILSASRGEDDRTRRLLFRAVEAPRPHETGRLRV